MTGLSRAELQAMDATTRGARSLELITDRLDAMGDALADMRVSLEPIAAVAQAVFDGRLQVRVRVDIEDDEQVQRVDVWVDEPLSPPGVDEG